MGAAGHEVRPEARRRQLQDGQIHGVQHAGEREHREPDPLDSRRPARVAGTASLMGSFRAGVDMSAGASCG